jgi:hypothetical protein
MMSMILWLEMFEEPSKREGCSIGVGVVWRFVVVAMRPTVESHAYMLSRGSWKKIFFLCCVWLSRGSQVLPCV